MEKVIVIYPAPYMSTWSSSMPPRKRVSKQPKPEDEASPPTKKVKGDKKEDNNVVFIIERW